MAGFWGLARKFIRNYRIETGDYSPPRKLWYWANQRCYCRWLPSMICRTWLDAKPRKKAPMMCLLESIFQRFLFYSSPYLLINLENWIPRPGRRDHDPSPSRLSAQDISWARCHRQLDTFPIEGIPWHPRRKETTADTHTTRHSLVFRIGSSSYPPKPPPCKSGFFLFQLQHGLPFLLGGLQVAEPKCLHNSPFQVHDQRGL